MRNPTWSRDELIVTLDFYLSHKPKIPDNKSKEIQELSDFLNRLQDKIGGETFDKFRNVNGVYMKTMNFLRLDPDYKGRGLTRGGKDEEVVWKLYSNDIDKLRSLSDSIRSIVSSDTPIPKKDELDEDEDGEEGRILTITHKIRERDKKIVKRKKDKVLKEKGKLCCEVCDFDFSLVYGERGTGFIECHHTHPVSELKDGQKTKLSELSLVCSNCHRMIHTKKPWLSIDETREIIRITHKDDLRER